MGEVLYVVLVIVPVAVMLALVVADWFSKEDDRG